MLKLKSKSKSSSSSVDFLKLCKKNVCSIEVLASGRKLLNKRQCHDLSSKLSKATQNIGEVVLYCGDPAVLFQPALENLYRYLEKAKALVRNCGQEDWCAAAVFQCQNENAFREIVLEVGLCYNAIYELAKRKRENWNDPPQDLRQSSFLEPASVKDVNGDLHDLQRRLDDLANGYTGVKGLDYFRSGSIARKQSLAKYLLVKTYCSSLQPHANTLDAYSAILWTKVSEPLGTWGNSRFLGAGSGASGVCSTEWLGIPCAKKEFHGQASESSFLKEAGILAHLKHPCIINFICCGNGLERGDRFIAMELMEKSLFDLVEEQKHASFPLPVLIDMMLQIAHGVCYLHNQGVAHRDLKPQNVVVNRVASSYLLDYFCVKLVDFGMSKTKVEVSKANTVSYRGIGTTMYRAPEVHPMANPNGERKVNWFKADAFSFAMTCAHLLTLEIPFKDMNSHELYKELTKNARRPELPSMCPQDLVVLLDDCWKTNPHSRPSFLEIYTRLEIFKHKLLRGFFIVDHALKEDNTDFGVGFDFIKLKLKEEFSTQDLFDKKTQGEFSTDDMVSIIQCTCGCALERNPQIPMEPPYLGSFVCDICMDRASDGEVYRCEICQFDAHPKCVELKDKVNVIFHDHPLHLLLQDFCNNNPKMMCHFCEEFVLENEQVYKCEVCDIYAHAFCTKYTKEWMWYNFHPHPLMLVQCQSNERLFCICCNGEVKKHTWYYTCKPKVCAFELHPKCSMRSWNPPCIFDNLHRLDLIMDQRRFYCGKCAALGFSWFFHCDHCNVDIHIDCVDDNLEDEDNLNVTYQTLMLEYETLDDHAKTDMIRQLLDELRVSKAMEASSSSTSSLPGRRKVQPTFQTPAPSKKPNLDTFDDMDLRNKIVVETRERKAKRLAIKGGRQKPLEMLENLEKVVYDLQNSDNISKADAVVLAASNKKLSSWKKK